MAAPPRRSLDDNDDEDGDDDDDGDDVIVQREDIVADGEISVASSLPSSRLSANCNSCNSSDSNSCEIANSVAEQTVVIESRKAKPCNASLEREEERIPAVDFCFAEIGPKIDYADYVQCGCENLNGKRGLAEEILSCEKATVKLFTPGDQRRNIAGHLTLDQTNNSSASPSNDTGQISIKIDSSDIKRQIDTDRQGDTDTCNESKSSEIIHEIAVSGKTENYSEDTPEKVSATSKYSGEDFSKLTGVPTGGKEFRECLEDLPANPGKLRNNSGDLRGGSGLLDVVEGEGGGEEWGEGVAEPPDGGWGWMVVLASFVAHVIADGCGFSFGVLFSELLEVFGETKGRTAWVGSLFVSVPAICGPIASAVTNRYGCRWTTIIGGVVTSVGCFLSAYTTSIGQLCVTFGIIAGFGLSLVFVPTVVIVAFYFEKRRAFATGIAVAGSGIGTVIFAPLTEFLIDRYQWRGALTITSAILLNIVVCGALFRPIGRGARARQARKSSDDVTVTSSPPQPVLVMPRAVSRRCRRLLLKYGGAAQLCGGSSGGQLRVQQQLQREGEQNLQEQRLKEPEQLNLRQEHEQLQLNGKHEGEWEQEDEQRNRDVTQLNLIAQRPQQDGAQQNLERQQAAAVADVAVIVEEPHGQPDVLPTSEDIQESQSIISIHTNGLVLSGTNSRDNSSSHLPAFTDSADQICANGVDISLVQDPSLNSFAARVGDKNTKTASCQGHEQHHNSQSAESIRNSHQPHAINSLAMPSLRRQISNSTPDASQFLSPDGARAKSPRRSLSPEGGSDSACRELPWTAGHGRRYSDRGAGVQIRRQDMVHRGSLLTAGYFYTSRAGGARGGGGAGRSASCPDFVVRTERGRLGSGSGRGTRWRSHSWRPAEILGNFARVLDVAIFRSAIFNYFCAHTVLLYISYDIPYVYGPVRAISQGMSESSASVLVSIIGLFSTVGQILMGYLGDKTYVDILPFYNTMTSVAGAVTLLMPLAFSFASLATLCAAYGFFISANFALTTVILVELLGMKQLTNAFGIVSLAQGVSNLIGPPLAGWISDETQSFDAAFYSSGCIICLSGFMLFAAPCLVRCEAARLDLYTRTVGVVHVLIDRRNVIDTSHDVVTSRGDVNSGSRDMNSPRRDVDGCHDDVGCRDVKYSRSDATRHDNVGSSRSDVNGYHEETESCDFMKYNDVSRCSDVTSSIKDVGRMDVLATLQSSISAPCYIESGDPIEDV